MGMNGNWQGCNSLVLTACRAALSKDGRPAVAFTLSVVRQGNIAVCISRFGLDAAAAHCLVQAAQAAAERAGVPFETGSRVQRGLELHAWSQS